MSASPLSLRTWSTAGFIAIYRPFFSEVLLPDEEGKYYAVTDYRHAEAISIPSPNPYPLALALALPPSPSPSPSP